MTATQTTKTVSTTTDFVGPVKPKAKYLQQRDARKRYSFGNVWLNAVLAGVVTDKDKLVAHAVSLKAGRKYDLSKLKLDTLLAKVQAKLLAPAADTTTTDVQ